jgi:hypothetical protein
MRIEGQHESSAKMRTAPARVGQVHVSCAREAQDPAAVPQLAELTELDQLIAGHAFGRAAGAFSDAAAAAREHNLGKARKLAAEAADHLATAERAQNGLGFQTYPRS